MQNINLKTSQDAGKTQAAYEAYNRVQSKSGTMQGLDAYDAVEQVQYDRTAEIGTTAQTVMDNFEEYRRDMQEKAKTEQEQETSDEEQARKDAREIARSLTQEEIKKLRMMGVDVSSADLSDLMELVNSMRDQAHKEDLANVLAQAKVEEGDTSQLVFTSTGPQIAGTGVKLQVENRDILYLLRNKLTLSQENLYKAHYSGQEAPQESKIPDSMQTQLQHIIEQAGIPVDDTSMDGAKMMVANGIPVTTDSVRSYMEMQTWLGASIEALPVEDTTEDVHNLEERANQLCRDVAALADADVIQAVQEGRPLTIAAMLAGKYAAQDTARTGRMGEAGTEPKDDALRMVTARRQMEEIRLSMTQQAAVRMLRSDINIDTRDLSQVVAKLRSVEAQMTKELFARYNVEATNEMTEAYTEFQTDLQAIGDAPASKLGLLLDTETVGTEAADAMRTVTVRSFAALVTERDAEIKDADSTDVPGGQIIRRSADFAAAQREYEALGTAPRTDMGDSIRKAFTNVDAILQDMQLPVDAEHVRAVRILGYNSIPVTEENLQQVLVYDREVNDLLAACQPGAVLSMIRDGINPLDMSIDELNQTLREKKYRAGVKETEDFATFLRDVERRGKISPEERAGYIGMFRVMKKLEQSGDREAGYLFANGSRLTVRNLITAMRSRKAAGMDISVDEAFGALTDLQTRGTKIDAQIEAAFARERNLEKAEKTSVDMGNTEPPQELEEMANPWMEISDADDTLEAEQFLQAQELEESAVNVQAARILLHGADTIESTDIYDLLAQAMKQLHLEDHTTEDAVDAETGAMAKSLAGEEIALPFEPVSLLEQLGRGDDLSLSYADLQQQLVEQMYTQAQLGSPAMDFQNLKLVQAGFRILGAMAKKRQYQLPVATKSGTRLVNLTLQTGADQQGTIDIQLPSARFGRISASLHVDAEGRWTGAVLSDSSDGNAELGTQAEAFRALLADSAYADATITFGQSRRASQEYTEQHDVTMKKLCEASVFFVKALAQLSDK